jgi:hypothetical protein
LAFFAAEINLHPDEFLGFRNLLGLKDFSNAKIELFKLSKRNLFCRASSPKAPSYASFKYLLCHPQIA